MLKSIKFILKNYKSKDGREFSKATCKGEYLPLALAETDVYYTIKFTSKSLSPMPSNEGVYEVSFDENGIWIDSRIEQSEKHIVRINAKKVVFSKPLEKRVEEATK